MASSSSTPSSTITLPKKYHVFLSFRAPDTRVGLTSHLYDALSRKQIVTFIDYELVRGDEISPALLNSIQESRIAVIIFSKDYASSKWCLRELAEIMKCKKLHELIVRPIFYHVDPSDVRKQTGPFKDSFAKHENESQDEVQEWREAFTEASNLSGWAYAGTRSVSELICDIVEDVQRKLMSEIEKDFEGLIGIDKRIEQVMSLLCLGTMDVRTIGIWGMSGIGKTTLAKAVFNRILGQFDGSCFIENIGEKLENKESNRLLLEVLSKVLHEENLKLDTPTNIIPPFIKERFNRAKVFIVIDDVNNFIKSETLVQGLIQCGLGSRIIITSRDIPVLYNFNSNIYKVDGLNFDEALMLFSNYAFNQNHPMEDFMALSKQMVYYANGNPLALRVLGSALLRMNKQEWESAVDDLQGIGGYDIFNVLKISYDRLNDKEKNLFLDIACFFNYDREDYVAELLDCKYSLSVLINKSLITIDEYRRIKMHDLLQEMGREIVRRESPKNPGKHSRLWKLDGVIWTLKNNKGTGAVEGISLDMDDLEDDLILGSQVFDKMHNLKLLSFTSNLGSYKVYLSNGLNSLPDDLIILGWHFCPLRVLPSNFSLEKLVCLNLYGSNIEQLWEGTKHTPKLKWLILSYCQHLTRIPNLSGFLSLEEVSLTGCISLVEFPSVQQLNKLWYLCLDGCSNVTKFPLTSASIESLNLSGTAIEEVPSSIQSLTNLTKLDLSGCTRLKHISTSICKLKSLPILDLINCSQIETFPEILETMESLKSLKLSGTAITELHSSIEHLNGLQRLTLSDCKNLEMLPSSICDLTSLEFLYLSNCAKLDKLPENLGNLKSLKELRVERSAVGQLPSSIRYLENLEILDCSECWGLTKLPPLSGLRSLSRLYLKKCNLMEIPEDIGCLSSLEWLDLRRNMFESLPKSIKHLSKLKTLLLRDCNMLRSLTELPVALKMLEAVNCKQLCQALPDSSEFKLCITSKYHEDVRFLFTNCFNLDQKAVSNVFEESLKGSEESPTQFSIYLPGNKIPEWFTNQSSGSSINIQVLRQDLVNRKFMGFAICATLGIEEYHNDHDFLAVDIYCHFETCDDHIYFLPSLDFGDDLVLINSDHILLGYSSFSKFLSSSQNLEMLPDNECDYVDIRFEFNYTSEDFEIKYCAVHPIYAKTMESLKAHKLSGFSVIRPDSPSDFEGLIGIHKRIEHVKSLLCADMKDVRKIIGIWGMGGVGKTTIARAVFKSISDQFDGACFIEKVGKRLENGGSDRLQLEVLSKVLHEENLKLGTPTIHPFMMELLNQKKVFIVLDNVNNFLQLETLAQGLNRCGLGSRIIITSKDKQVLCNSKIDLKRQSRIHLTIDDHEIHEEKGLDDDEALELFCKYANPTEDCMALSYGIVYYAKGNPLALKVLGSSLKGKSKQVWESALNNLQGIVNPKIFDVLKINYDGLNEEEKKLFLDLACFGDLYNYHGLLKEEFLDCMCLEYSLSVLVAKSLITRHIRTGDIEMHDLLQEMGRKIVCGEPPKELGMRSRLWEQNDVIWTLEKNTGTNAVEGISLDMDGLEDIHLSSQVFDKMHNLRFLIFHSMYGSNKVLHLPNDLNCLPDELMFLHWLGYPLRVLPSSFNPKELVKLDLSGSNIKQLWDVTKCAPKLKWLILSYCEHLTRIPNLSDFPLLVEVDLSHCESLVDFPSSDQQHNYLRNLNMSKTAIKEVPSSIQSLTNLTELKLAECTRLKHISTSICKLKSLSTLDLTDCSKLESFPEILETMESLKALKLSAFFKIDMDLKVLPLSIERLNGLRSLTLNGCKNLEMLPSSICNLTSLEDLHLSYCSKRVKLPDNLENLKSLKRLTVTGSAVGQLPSSITCLVNLEDLDCSGCSLMEIPKDIDRLSSLKKLKLSRNMFESLPKSIKQLSKLEFLSLSHCNMLRSLPEFPEGLECLEAMDCDQLCQVPDASEFVSCINSKSHFANYHHHHHDVDFIFTNSLNLIKAVSNVFDESLQIMQRIEKGSGKPPNEFSIYLPGNKIPKMFYNQSLDHGICNKIQHESSINIKVLRNDLVNRKFMGFAICAVFGCDENNIRVRFTHGVGCVFETYYDRIKICNGNRIYRTHYGSDLPSIFIDSDHMLLGYCSFYSRNPIPAGDSDYVDISIEFKICDKGNQLKCCAVCPIYAEIGETNGRRSDRSDDNDEEVEPHPK